MPHLHPRQRLLRDAVALTLVSVCALALAGWWALAPARGPAPAPDAQAVTPVRPPRAPASPPRGQLWRPATDVPVAQAAPLPAPTLRLITLSQREGRWTALIDPGNGAPSERVGAGDTLSGWQISQVDGNGVEVTSGTQHHSLRFGP